MTANSLISRAPHSLRRMIAAAAVAAFVVAGCAEAGTDDVDASLEETTDEASAAVDEAAEAIEDTDPEEAEELVDETAEDVDDVAEDTAAEIDERSAAIAQILRDNDMESLASAVELVDASELVGDGAFTLFGPNDDAFRELDTDILADLLSDPAQLSELLQNHIIIGERVDSTALSGMDSVETSSGNSVSVSVDGDTVTVGGSTVVNADVDAADGVIHVIDSVIMP